MQDPCFGAYSSITDLLFGFDETILQSAFGVWIYLLIYGLYFVVLEMILGNLSCKIQICVYLASQATLVDALFLCVNWIH